MRGTINLLLDTAHESPYLFRSRLPVRLKYEIFFTYIKISLKLFSLHRVKKQTKENILGFTIETFDYGALHFLFREIFLKNTYYFKKTEKGKMTIFDCGSNIGLSIVYFKMLYPTSTIHAFEPDPRTFALLSKNITTNNIKNVFLHNTALHKKTGYVDFYLDNKNPGWLTMSTLKDRMPDKDMIKVKSVPLSTFITTDINFLKMDIEGAESIVFEELIESDKIKKIKKMAVEYHLYKKNTSAFASFVKNIEDEGYSLEFSTERSGTSNQFQDIMVYIDKNT